MATEPNTVDQRYRCSLCPQTPQTTLLFDDYCWTTLRGRHDLPIVVLKRHTDSPTAGEWHHIESLARRQFPDYRWRRPAPVTKHFYLHALDWNARCSHDHTEAEHARHPIAASLRGQRVAASVDMASPYRTAAVGAALTLQAA